MNKTNAMHFGIGRFFSDMADKSEKMRERILKAGEKRLASICELAGVNKYEGYVPPVPYHKVDIVLPARAKPNTLHSSAITRVRLSQKTRRLMFRLVITIFLGYVFLASRILLIRALKCLRD
ncbi:hypothetical protein ACOME3_004850 [Neoechinorhynchus agilis]